MANIYDVAKEAGVSRSTVSRVINNNSEVSEKTKQRVLVAIEKLNYSPNASARSLALNKNGVIAVVSRYMLSDPFYSKVAEYIYRIADKRGYGIFFCINERDTKSNLNYFRMLYGKADGIIFLGYDSVKREELVKFVDRKYPIVLFENNINIPGIVKVNLDNYYGGYVATRYLIQKGHKRIAHYKGQVESFEVIDRLRGYKSALQDYNISYDNSIVIDGQFSYEEAYNQADKLLKNKDITAVFCDSDLMAWGFIEKALELGIKIPQDISVIGFDDINYNLRYDLKGYKKNMDITTLRQPIYKMSEYAVDALVENIETGNIKDDKIFSPELIEKGTTIDK